MPDEYDFNNSLAQARANIQRREQEQTAPKPAVPNTTNPDPTANPQGELGVTDYLSDAALGVGAGVEGFFKSVGKLGDDIVETLGGDLADDSVWENSIKTKTWAGGLTSGITQFALGFVPAMGLAGAVGKAAGIASGIGKLALTAGAGVAADFVSFKEHESRLSNIVQEMPALRNPVTEYLAAKPDDGWAEGRFKNALEGLALGGVTDVLFKSVRGLKNLGRAEAGGDKSAILAASEQTYKEVTESIHGPPKPANLVEDLAKAGKGVPKAVPDDLAEKLTLHILSQPERPLEEALGEGIATHVNLDRLLTDGAGRDAIIKMTDLVDGIVQKNIGGRVSLEDVASAAQDFAERITGDGTLLKNAFTDARNIKGMGTRLVAYRTVRNAFLKEATTVARKIEGAIGDDAHNLMTKLGDLAEVTMNLDVPLQIIQTEGARIPSFGRVLAGDSVQAADESIKAMKNMLAAGRNGITTKKLVNALIMADGDTGSISKLFDWAGKQSGGLFDMHQELWVNALLSGTRTQATNFLSNLMNTFVMPAERAIGGMFTGDMQAVRSGFRLYGGIVSSFLDVFHLTAAVERTNKSTIGSAIESFRNESPMLDALTKGDIPPSITAKNVGLSSNNPVGVLVNYLGKIVRMPTRTLTATDTLFKQLNYRAALRDEGFRLAEDAGLKDGTAMAEFVNAHISKGFDDLGRATSKESLNYARNATFTQELFDGTLGKSLSEMAAKHPGLRLFVPFIKTPTNIFRRFVQYTPGINMLQKEFRMMWNSADSIERAQARGRMTVGGALTGTAVTMAASGKLTGGGPSNTEQRNALLATGWRPYSFVVNNDDGTKEYLDYRRLEPFSNLLGLVADFADIGGHLSDPDNDGLAQALSMAVAKNITSKTYLTGLTELVNVMSEPDKNAKRFIQNRVASYVPNLFAQANDDPYMRETRTLMDTIKSRIPGFSDSLAPKRNLFGEPVNVRAGWLPFGAEGTATARMMSPVAYSKSVGDPVKEELAKLSYGFTMPTKRYKGFDLADFKAANGQDAYDRMVQLQGQVKVSGKTLPEALTRLIESPRYKAMPEPTTPQDTTNPRVMAVNGLLADYRERSQSQVLREFPGIKQAVRTQQAELRQKARSPVLARLQGAGL